MVTIVVVAGSSPNGICRLISVSLVSSMVFWLIGESAAGSVI